MASEKLDEKSIFNVARQIQSPDARAEYLRNSCGADGDLHKRVGTLLRAYEEQASFLEMPPVGGLLTNLVPERRAPVDAEHIADVTQDGTSSIDPGDYELEFLTPSDKPDSLGRLGHYDIQEVIGRGGMGIVLRAFDEKLHRVVAIKVMAAQLATSATARKRFTREAQAAAAVSHDHVVTIHAVEEANGRPYIAMQYVAGMSLEERIERGGPLELHEILRIGMQTAAGLVAAHAQGLIHRDIKPANILLENGVERVKITDFGLARAAAEANLTQSGAVVGTPHYMAPEQARGDALDARTDLFSLGSVLYAMCTGRSPFRASGTMAVLKRVCEQTPTPIRETNPEIPDWLVAIIYKLHAKDPAERFQTAAEVADLLSRHLAHVQHPSVAPLPAVGAASRAAPGPARLAGPTLVRHRWAIAAAVLLCCLSGGLSLTEATGVTQLVSTVIRIMTPDGTLVVDVNDPGVQVMIEGDGGIVITGAGLQQVRLKPGNYKVQAAKDGKPVPLDQELVTITRGDKQVVRVRLEGEAAAPKVASQGNLGVFVLLGAKGAFERKFETLAEAVQGASNGDTIEIRGNGPFVSDGVTTANALVIRAGEGYAPSITLSQTAADKNIPLLTTSAALVLEGLEMRRIGGAEGTVENRTPRLLKPLQPGALYVANCRLIFKADRPHLARGGLFSSNAKSVFVRNSVLSSHASGDLGWGFPSGGHFSIENCVSAFAGLGFEDGDFTDVSIRVRGNSFAGKCMSLILRSKPNLPASDETPPPIRLDFSNNVALIGSEFRSQGVLRFHQYQLKPPFSTAEMEALLPRLVRLDERQNVYLRGTPMLGVGVDGKAIEGTRDLADWARLWKQSDTGSFEGDVRFQGGDLIQKALTAPQTLTAEDFRLRPDSPGYRAGPDGKDLGADVDLVGTGPAYERWKRTPEYPEWLKETGQVEAAAAKPVNHPFVVLAGQGIPERKFGTLAEAVQIASDGDTIEIRGNGPFVSEPIDLQRTALTIRAGAGFRPVIRLNSEASHHKGYFLATNAALVLEGLELHRAPPKDSVSGGWTAVHANEAPLRAANCRFGGPIWAEHSPVCVFRNCEFLSADGGGVAGRFHSGSKFIFENCLHRIRAFPIGFQFDDAEIRDTSIQITRNTFANGGTSLWLVLRSPLPGRLDPAQNSEATRIEVSESIFDSPGVLGIEQTREFLDSAAVLAPAEADAMLLRLLQWRGERNLFAAGGTSVRWSAEMKPLPSRGPQSLQDWKQFWGSSETDSREGRLRFQGGNLLARTAADLDQLKPEDFRLRPDSAGYRAGPDGKDLGADVDLVGPGPAYERWKETPEYQEWLKDTKQAKPATLQAVPKAFVLLGGKNIAERKFDTLAEAVHGASNGDTIEVRGNGPFLSPRIDIGNQALTLRAGEGFRPVIKLSPAADQGDVALLITNAALVLEGLELHRGSSKDQRGRPSDVVRATQAPLRAANCRFRGRIWAQHSPVCVFHNCEFLTETEPVGERYRPGARVVFDNNCLLAKSGISVHYDDAALDDVSIQFTRNTFVGNSTAIYLNLHLPVPGPSGRSPALKPIRLDVSESIFDVPRMLSIDQTRTFLDKAAVLEASEADATLWRLVEWRAERNLFAFGSTVVKWTVDRKEQQPLSGPTSLEEWKALWGGAESDSLEGRLRFQGGNLVSRSDAGLDQLTPEDFRLLPDSAGYRAGPDGKDLGADVDLVGPGAAYERWKKTPEYHEWLKDAGQK